MEISVVIATYNRAEILSRSVPALLTQRTDGFNYEVIFVDDGSTDATPAILKQAAADYPARLRYFRGPHSGSPGAPRNLGVRQARGEIILLLDDDVIPNDNLLLEHSQFHRSAGENVAAVGQLYLPPDVKRDPMSIFHSFPYGEMKPGVALDFCFFWTCNVSLKRSFMLANGMFDEDSSLHPLEDMECGYRLIKNGLRLEYLPLANGQHVHKMKAEWVPAKGQRLGRAQFAVIQKVTDVRMKEWLALVSPDLPLPALVLRLLKRALLRIVDNPVTLFALRRVGAEGEKRSRVTDLFYYLQFRRNVLSGYREARRAGRIVLPPKPPMRSELVPENDSRT